MLLCACSLFGLCLFTILLLIDALFRYCRYTFHARFGSKTNGIACYVPGAAIFNSYFTSNRREILSSLTHSFACLAFRKRTMRLLHNLGCSNRRDTHCSTINNPSSPGARCLLFSSSRTGWQHSSGVGHSIKNKFPTTKLHTRQKRCRYFTERAEEIPPRRCSTFPNSKTTLTD